MAKKDPSARADDYEKKKQRRDSVPKVYSSENSTTYANEIIFYVLSTVSRLFNVPHIFCFCMCLLNENFSHKKRTEDKKRVREKSKQKQVNCL